MKQVWSSAIALAAATVGLNGQAAAQTAETETTVAGEIVVTVQKREQALQDVPIAVTAYTGETLERIGITKLDELSLFVPGLEIQEQSPNNPGFVIRGVTSDDGAGFQEQRVAVFQDGVPISRARGAYVGLFDVERIEVAKGPQATLFGRGALVGALNIIRNKADVNALSGQGNIQVGDYEQLRLEGAVNVPLIEGLLAVRAAGLSQHRDGIVRNTLGSRLGGYQIDAHRFSVALTPTPQARIELVYDYQEDDWLGTSFKSGTYAALGGDRSPFTPASLNRSSPVLEGGQPIGIQRTLQSTTLTGEFELDDTFTLNLLGSLRTFDALEIFDPDGFSVPAILAAEDADGEQDYVEARLSFDNGGRFYGFIGASYFAEEASQRVPLAINLTALSLIAQGRLLAVRNDVTALPAPFQAAIAADGVSVSTFLNTGSTESIDFFGDLTFRVSDRLELTGGLRVTEDEKTSSILATIQRGVPTLFAPTPGGVAQSRSGEFEGTTWRLVGRYELNDDWSLFASYARGRRPEVITANAPASFSVVQAEEVDSYEVGAKGSLYGGDLALDGSVYFYQYENFQSTQFTPQGTIVPFNAGSAEAPGFEGQAAWRALDSLQLIATYAYNGFEFTSGARNGNRSRLSPEHSLSLFADLSYPIRSWGSAYFRPSYTWQSEVFFDDDNDKPQFQCRPFAAAGVLAGGAQRSPLCAAIPIGGLPPGLTPSNVANFDDTVQDELQEAYGLLNVRFGFENASGRWGAGVFITNALDEEYVIDAGNTGDSFGGATFIRGAPRLIGLELKGQF